MAVLKHVDFEVPNFGELAAAPTPVPSYPDAVMGLGPTANWRMGETSGTTLADQTMANPLALSGTYTLGESGALAKNNDGAVRFSSGQAVSVSPVFPVGAAAAFSFVFWVRVPAAVVPGAFVTQSHSTTTGQLRIILRANGTLRYLVNGDSQLDSTQIVSSNWRMVTITRTLAGTMSWYFDGQLDTQAAGHDKAIHSNTFRIGRIAATVPDVIVDEAAMFDVALSAEQIQWLYGLGNDHLAHPPSS